MPMRVSFQLAEETYTKATLGVNQHTLSGEQKILGVKWNDSRLSSP